MCVRATVQYVITHVYTRVTNSTDVNVMSDINSQRTRKPVSVSICVIALLLLVTIMYRMYRKRFTGENRLLLNSTFQHCLDYHRLV